MGMAVFWDVASYSLIYFDRRLGGAYCFMMEAVSSSETSVRIYQTKRCNIPEDSHQHIRHHDYLKSQLVLYGLG
jgi:hypothetical protein